MEATKAIRNIESNMVTSIDLSENTVAYGRIPIVAVSASLAEARLHEYVQAGFDGWILKPIDFQRLEAILTAIRDDQMRRVLLYGSGSWEKGGWFIMRKDEAVNF
tara:strand:- start:90 stop:404 length:315 start_codon:yes stop_codon:yes gene_type:complete